MERKGYVMQGKGAESITSNATSSQLLGMSTSTRHYDMSLPKKKHRVITEYYPGQQEVHSINQVEADMNQIRNAHQILRLSLIIMQQGSSWYKLGGRKNAMVKRAAGH